MPNYYYNTVKAPKDVLEDLYEDGRVTFEKLLPIPKNLKITEGEIVKKAVACAMSKKSSDDFFKIVKAFKDKKESYYENYWNMFKEECSSLEKIKEYEKELFFSDEDVKKLGIKNLVELGNMYINNFLEYGCLNWYDWCIENWDTKWDAVDFEGSPEQEKLTFLTAWSEPKKVIEKLFEKHPNANIVWEYESEMHGEGKGKYYFNENGEMINQELEEELEDEEEE